MFKKIIAGLLTVSAMAAAQQAQAITWTDWTSGAGGVAAGTVGGVSVNYAGDTYFVQTGASGETFYWIGGPNAPTTTDLVGNIYGGVKTITFSQPVNTFYMAVVSWNGQNVTFSAPIDSVESEPGYWGSGSYGLFDGNTRLEAYGELHGIIKFSGTFSSISWTDLTEGWHGFTIGIDSVSTAPGVPEPASWAMMIGGLGLVGAAMRRRKVSVSFG